MNRDLKKRMRATRVAPPRLKPEQPDIKGNAFKLLFFILIQTLMNSRRK